MDNIFLQLSVLMGITVSIAFVMRLFRQPLIVAYIIAGLVAGPLFLNLVAGGEDFFHTFAEFGIVLLLFIVGLSLNFEYIKKVGKKVLVGGLIQFFLTVGIGLGLMYFFNFSFVASLFLAISLSFSSTIIIIKLLADKRDSEAVYGRYVVGLLLIQDVIAVIIMIFLNTSSTSSALWYHTVLTTAGKGLLLAGAVFLMSRYLLPHIMDKIAKNGEMLFIFTIAWCFGIASLVYWSGFSVEIGAIIAGISLGASPYQPEISSRIRPLRDFFIVLFFIVLGSELKIVDVRSAVMPAIVLSAFVLIFKPILLYFVMRFSKHTRRTSFLAATTAGQVSEFGFILLFTAASIGYVTSSELAILTLVALITIIVSSYFITYNEKLYNLVMPLMKKLGEDEYRKLKEDKVKQYPVWVFGYHRIGWKVCEALAEKKIKFAVVDFDPASISKLKHRGIPAFFGDAADVEFLESLPLHKARLIVSTIPEADDQRTLITHIRQHNKKIHIIANLYHSDDLDELYAVGADYVMMPHLLGGQWIAGILKDHRWNKTTFRKIKKAQKDEMQLRFTAATHD
jgi:Kef-type K+ transport system membrane component KefB